MVEIFSSEIITSKNTQQRLLIWAALFLLLLSIILTLSPAARYRNWDVDYHWWHWVGYFLWLGSSISIHRSIKAHLRNSDPFIFMIAQLMTGWGLLTIWRIDPFFGFRQTLWLSVCTIVSIILIRTPSILNQMKRYKYFWLAIGLSLIILTYIFGTYPGGIGPKLWLGFNGVFFQPSELLKIILIFFLASYFSEKQSGNFNFIHTIIPATVLFLALLVILIGQRDLGTALIFIAIYIFMVYFVFGKKRILIFGSILLGLSAVAGYFLIDLIRIRFQAWILPWGNTQSSSYQIIQSIISLAAGGLFGAGIGLGYPDLVPLSHSDFIFTAIAEETGLIGSIGFISLLVIFLFRGIKVSIKSTNRFHRYLSAGITTYIIAQSILIIGGNIRLFPITGVTLPFVSYGGSSLLTSYLALSMLLIISSQKEKQHNLVTRSTSFRIVTAIFSFFLIAITITIGWWGIIRGNDLQDRSDNPRHLISNTYVRRGQILDRNNQIIGDTEGEPGSFNRYYPYPPLSNSVGYIHQKYGLYGIEKEYDEYLSGIKGYPAYTLWMSYLLYDQPPDGRSIRLTLDMDLQRAVDDLIRETQGAAVVFNAESGEILAISTYPFFDANQLEENWDNWNNSENAPFLNRASQGAYPIGGLLSPLLLFEQDIDLIKNFDDSTIFPSDKNTPECESPALDLDNWQSSIKNGCLSALSQFIIFENLAPINESPQFEFIFNAPEIGFPINPSMEISPEASWIDLISGKDQIRTSPLQIAASLAPLSNGGYIVEPMILSSVYISSGQWVILPLEEKRAIIKPEKAGEISQLLTSDESNIWELSAVTYDSNDAYSWYAMGTTNGSRATPIVIAAVIETDNREKIQSIGKKIFNALSLN
jgi:cell division protein FtsW (lipid II flippase)